MFGAKVESNQSLIYQWPKLTTNHGNTLNMVYGCSWRQIRQCLALDCDLRRQYGERGSSQEVQLVLGYRVYGPWEDGTFIVWLQGDLATVVVQPQKQESTAGVSYVSIGGNLLLVN